MTPQRREVELLDGKVLLASSLYINLKRILDKNSVHIFSDFIHC